jgi:hypothetical protein
MNKISDSLLLVGKPLATIIREITINRLKTQQLSPDELMSAAKGGNIL